MIHDGEDIIVNVFLMSGGEKVSHRGNGTHKMMDKPRCPEETGQLLLGISELSLNTTGMEMFKNLWAW